jgi:hypothetical protein
LNPLKKLASQTAVYGLSQIVGRFVNYLLVPLHTALFDTADFGINTLMYSYVTFFNVLLTYGMETAFFRFSQKHDKPAQVYSTALTSLISSSLFFGLLHINVYIPGYLGWATYSHVMSAFGFGMIMCGLMIVTRTIWAPVLFHTLMNWHIPFEKDPKPIADNQVYSLWDNVTMPLSSLVFEACIMLMLIGLDRARIPHLPQWFWRLAYKFKLVDSK